MSSDKKTEEPVSPSVPPAGTHKPTRLTYGIAAFLILLFLVQLISSLQNKSPTADEVTYISSGYYMLRTGDLSLHLGHPVHLQMLIAAPLLLLDLELPAHDEPFFGPGNFSLLESWVYARDFIYESNSGQAGKIILLPRLVVAGLAVILAIFVFMLGNKLYSRNAGLFALFLFAFSPNILAHSRLGNLDMGTTAFFFMAIYFFISLLEKPGRLRFILAGLFLGLCFLTKMTAIYLVPVFFVFIIPVLFGKVRLNVFRLRERFSNPGTASVLSFLIIYLGVMAAAWLLVCAGYGFQGMFKPLGYFLSEAPAENAEVITTTQDSGTSIKSILKAAPVPLPADYFSAFKFQLYHSKRGHRSFLLGEHSSQGWWYYYLVAFVLKVPVPVMIFILLWLWYIFFRTGIRNLESEEWYLIIAAACMFVLFSMGRVQIGFRYLLPIFPLGYVLVSRLMTAGFMKNIRYAIPIGIICLWYLVSSVIIYPHYLAYFNEPSGGPGNGYKFLVDSNLDWGQDLAGLKEYMDENGIDSIKLSYFGSAAADYYNINYEYLPSIGLKPVQPGGLWWYEDGYVENCGPVEGLIAVSATNLQGLLFENRDCFSWLKEYEPIAKIGYSIFIYDIPAVEGKSFQ